MGTFTVLRRDTFYFYYLDSHTTHDPVAVTEDGSKIVHSDMNLFHITDAQHTVTVPHGDNIVLALAWAPNGQQFVAAYASRQHPCIWSLECGTWIQRRLLVKGAKHPCKRLVWSPDGKWIAGIITTWHTAIIYDATTLCEKRRCWFGCSKWPYLDLAWSPDSQCLALLTELGVVQVWTLGEYNDKSHRHFSSLIRAIVLALMCVVNSQLPLELQLLLHKAIATRLDTTNGCCLLCNND
jgi:WD40 repeat protein